VTLLPEQEDIVSLLDCADMLVHPALFEGMPLVVLEAMARGVPVIASAVSGIPEAVGDTGILIDPSVAGPGFGEQLAAAIETFAGDADRRQQMAHAARQRARAFFTEERMLRDHLALIQEQFEDRA
jgi:glycosyltransferase involved in cell wall biosynthesis